MNLTDALHLVASFGWVPAPSVRFVFLLPAAVLVFAARIDFVAAGFSVAAVCFGSAGFFSIVVAVTSGSGFCSVAIGCSFSAGFAEIAAVAAVLTTPPVS